MREARIAERIVAERVPMCANCGRKIKVWAKAQGSIPATTVSMLLCDRNNCNLEAAKDVRGYLVTKES